MKTITVLLITALLVPAALASGATIIQPNTPTSNVAANAGSLLAALANGAGLSTTVTTGSDTATALSVTHLTAGGGATGGALNQNYVTAASGSDYFALGVAPVLTFTLSASFNQIDSIVVWNYASASAGGMPPRNSTRTFDLEFFSDTAATLSLGTSPGLSLTQSLGTEQVAQQVFFPGGAVFSGVQAVKMTLTDNYFGTGSGLGGDRVGLAEVRFSQVPEPSAILLGGLCAMGLLRRRR